jgi:pimeloyl-ACP methyl ester carboxylesterase
VAEIPEFFDSAERPVYGVTYMPDSPREGAPVVVHCHSLGVEQLTSYRSEVITARATAARGIPTFRFHSRGHGDSGGDFAAVTLEGMVEDALAAADRARERTRAEGVVFLGVRFGAMVAARAAARRQDVAGIALWEPVKRGEDYFRGMLRTLLLSQLASGRRPDATVDTMMSTVEREGRLDVHGYYLHEAIVRSARAATLEESFVGFRAPVLLVQIQARPALTRAHLALAEGLAAAGASVTTDVVAEEPGWNFVSNPAWRSADLTRITTEWLDALA